MEAWSGIVGPILADMTVPRRLSQGTLTIGCSGPVAMELQHLSTELLNRVNQYLGAQTVHRLRFVQIRMIRVPPKIAAAAFARGGKGARRRCRQPPRRPPSQRPHRPRPRRPFRIGFYRPRETTQCIRC